MFGWLKERRQRKKAIRLMNESTKELVKVYVDLAFSVIDVDARQYLDGTVLKCVYCGRTFVHDNRYCALGFCQHCS